MTDNENQTFDIDFEDNELIVELDDETDVVAEAEIDDEVEVVEIDTMVEHDPTVPKHVKAITLEDIERWNSGGPGGGVSDYELLHNKPTINGIELTGDKSLNELGIKQEYTANDITFKDGSTFQEKYDSGELKGEPGEPGKDGEDGKTPIKGVDYFDGKDGVNGTNGKDGYTPVKGVDYFDGVNGKDGYTPIKGKDYFDGVNGKDGVDGKTPVKGEDYYTEADKQEMVRLVLAALPSSEGVSY